MAKKKEQPAEEGSPAWMATFSDLMNLLLCFFVLLFASSTMDEGKIQKIAASFNNISFSIMNESQVSLLSGDMMSGGVTQVPDVMSILSEAGRAIEGNSGDNISSSATDAGNLSGQLSDEELKEEYDKRGEEQSEEMYEEIVQMAESYTIDDQIILDYNAQYVELNLNGSILFDSGKAEVREDSKMFLQKIASILVKYKYCTIEIEGHTDNVPISTSKYADNRALSTERARNVYDYLMSQENFIDQNMKIAGYGESKPVASNATEEGRAKNRRVVIKIYNQQNSLN
ncbi:MAG: flagellar motor protein MotB [Lachnospiraceae bacterium]|nr:flagellar motor protein MotB [Lachnospiraceae bacterium]